MARSNPTAVRPDLDGALITPLAPNADGDIVDAGATLVVTNGGGSPITVTFPSTATHYGVGVDDAGGPVAAGATAAFKVPPLALAGQPADATVGPNRVLADYSAVASVTRYVLAPS